VNLGRARSEDGAVESRVVTGGKPRAAVLTEISPILAAVFWGSNYAATKFAALSMPPFRSSPSGSRWPAS